MLLYRLHDIRMDLISFCAFLSVQNGQTLSFLGVQIIRRMGILCKDHLVVFPTFCCRNDILYRRLALLVSQRSGDEFVLCIRDH